MQKVHFIGIAGVGMSATALLLKEAGWQVTGSDAECYGPPRDILSRGGISFSLGYDPKNIPADADCFVIGRNAKLAPEENAEVRAALALGKPVYSFPEILGQLTKERENLVVAGSYGKSTMATIVAHILRHAGVDAGYFIGAEPVETKWLPSSAALGSAAPFILEGDEYPSAHDDLRAKFMHLHPHDIILTSVVHDHVNVYPSFTDYQKPFQELLALVPDDGIVVSSADEPNALALAQASGKKVISYGIKNSSADYRAADIHYGEKTHFHLIGKEAMLGEIETTLLGAHNVENIVGAVAYVLARGYANFAQILDAVNDFKGVHRRLDNIAPLSRVPIFEGFGSSYEKARTAIEAMTLHFPDKPLVIIFEPHTFGWRNRANLNWYDDVFKESSVVFIAPPATQGASTHDQLSHEEILTHVGVIAKPYTTPDTVVQSLSGNEVVLILTSGNLEGTIPTFVEEITKKFPV
ncbi:MAG: Mur ligase family protein [Candidatus Kaiserbacteria bacterium]|nr:Mur ligase family protein [Candidatus Kaiserbacteria bacterium]